MKSIQLIRNGAGGIDLLTERDAGNDVRILTGKPQYSKQFWTKLKRACTTALKELAKES